MSEQSVEKVQKYGVQSAPLHEAIHVGRLNKARTLFLDKEDGTDMVLYAVAQYVLDNFGGGMETAWDRLGITLRIEVERSSIPPGAEAER